MAPESKDARQYSVPGPGPVPTEAAGSEIPHDEWLSCLDAFSREHQGWTVTIEVDARGLEHRVEAESLPFEGITPEHSEGHDRISVAVGGEPDDPDDHLTHFITDPVRVRLLEAAGAGEV